MELLAPAGNFENFRAALDAGADAVYVGAPGLNARNPVRDLRLDEIGAMIQEVRERSKKIYIALNSLVKEQDLPELISILSYFEQIRPDGLIIQDLGVINLVRNYFPDLEMHGSTLMTAHSSLCAEFLGSLGMSRVVAAREMTIKELDLLVKKSAVDIEVFVHGAMCFSYSGLCLFSSYLGGKSGLRGNCVQPCRRKYTIYGGGKGRSKSAAGGYCFSMNDLSGLEMVPALRKMGVASLKIEGRLRSATYVRNVVGAYRMVLDGGSQPSADVMDEASVMIEEAMGRKTSSGYFLSPQPRDLIISHRSGNVGKFLGKVEHVEERGNVLVATLKLRHSCAAGDRLRVHLENGDRRIPFRVQSFHVDGKESGRAERGQKIGVVLPSEINYKEATGKIELFCVDVQGGLNPGADKGGRLQLPQKTQRLIKAKARQVAQQVVSPLRQNGEHPARPESGRKRKGGRKSRIELWFRLDNAKAVFEKMQVTPDKYLISMERNNLGLAGQLKKYLGRNMRSVVWALPPIITENNLAQVRKNISTLTKTGYRTFQVSHISQVLLFANERVQLYGDYTLNLLNSQAMKLVSQLNFRATQISIETDRQNLQRTVAGYRNSGAAAVPGYSEQSIQIGMTVYGAPPLFVSRIASGQLVYGKNLVSPKKEMFVIEKKDGYSLTRPIKPFSLLPYRDEIERFGINYLLVDLTGMKNFRKDISDLYERLSGRGKGSKLPTFNYLGTLD